MKHSIELNKKEFIDLYFDIKTLYKERLISSKKDYTRIELEINKLLGLSTIFDYIDKIPSSLFSSTKRDSEINMRAFWISLANETLSQISNPYEYDREKLIATIPRLRKYCTDENKGLLNVFYELFKCGVTVIFQSSLSKIGIRGATLIRDNKPCIVINNSGNKYPTLWFTLFHELYHVLFDLEQISTISYHLSGGSDIFIDEQKADEFARSYFVNSQNMQEVIPYIDDPIFVKEKAELLVIHKSIIYAWYCYDYNTWSKYHEFIPTTKEATKNINIELQKMIQENLILSTSQHEVLFHNPN